MLRTSGGNWTIDYEAVAEVLNATLPHVLPPDSENGTARLYWNNGGAVCAQPSINESYWTHKKTYMTSVSGSMFNRYMAWVQQYNATHTTYELWSVYEAFDTPSSAAYMSSQDCDSFAWDSWGALSALGAVFSPHLVARHDRVCLYSAAPQLVDAADAATYQKLLAFYGAFHKRNASTLVTVLDVLLQLTTIDKFVYYRGQYYLLQMHAPFIALRYDPDALPVPVMPSPSPAPAAAHAAHADAASPPLLGRA